MGKVEVNTFQKLKVFWRASQFVSVGIFCLSLWSTPALPQDSLWNKYTAAGVKALQQGNYSGAEGYFAGALRTARKTFGPKDPRLAESLNYLGMAHHTQRQYSKAEPLYEKALTIREHVLGPDHPDVAQSLNNLAEVYSVQRRYTDAELNYKRALSIWENALGPNNPEVGTGLNNLAGLYRSQGRYADAEPLYKRALKIALYKRALKFDRITLERNSPNFAEGLNNLAINYHQQGNIVKAEKIYRRSLRILMKNLSPNHPLLARVLENLGRLYFDQRKFDDAKPLYLKALAIIEKAYGPRHSRALNMRSNMTALFGAEIARKQYILKGEITEQRHNTIVFISVPPKSDRIFDVEVMSEHNALNKIRQAFDLLIKKSPLSASVINQLKKQGNVIIVYDPNFPTEDVDSTGVLLAAFIPDLVWPVSGGSISNNFPLIISRYLAKWSPEWMASGIAHELVGHGLQHSRRKFQSNLARISDIECEAWLYQEQAIQDLGMDKRGSEMVGHRQGLEKLCAGLKGYMATHTPSQTILWSALNPNVPKILSIFGEYIKFGR